MQSKDLHFMYLYPRAKGALQNTVISVSVIEAPSPTKLQILCVVSSLGFQTIHNKMQKVTCIPAKRIYFVFYAKICINLLHSLKCFFFATPAHTSAPLIL